MCECRRIHHRDSNQPVPAISKFNLHHCRIFGCDRSGGPAVSTSACRRVASGNFAGIRTEAPPLDGRCSHAVRWCSHCWPVDHEPTRYGRCADLHRPDSLLSIRGRGDVGNGCDGSIGRFPAQVAISPTGLAACSRHSRDHRGRGERDPCPFDRGYDGDHHKDPDVFHGGLCVGDDGSPVASLERFSKTPAI